MTKRIYRSILLVTALSLLLSCVLIAVALYSDYEQEYLEQIRSEAYTVSCALNEGLPPETLLPRLKETGAVTLRITRVSSDGTVLYDSEASSEQMENHRSREEIAEALEQGEGQSSRYSSTLSRRTFYYACRLDDGTVLRVSGERNSLWGVLFDVLKPVLPVFLLAIALCLFLAYRIAKRVVKPLNEVDLEHPNEAQTYEELSPLLQKIATQNRQIEQQLQELRRRQEEFTALTEHMSEALLIVDARGRLCMCNTTAKRLLDIDHPTGRHLTELNRSAAFRQAAEAAEKGQRDVRSVELEGRHYQLMTNPAYDGDTLTGATLVLLDVTERENREQLRREFSANVSHELRTPLTSISGFAELIATGMARQEDVPNFAQKIHKESLRLLNLIEDILRLSQLDEGVGGEKSLQRLDLLAAATARQLQSTAEKRNIRLLCETEPTEVMGVSSMLEELIYNLLDNAIKYNVPGGTVQLAVSPEEQGAVLRVSDTGIGIPAGEQERVFERFYRVDKSHSKAIGGTGLGLSIVKHAALFHKAELQLESTVGKGTSITVRFPRFQYGRGY